MVGRLALVLGSERLFPRQAHHDFGVRELEVGHIDLRFAVTCGPERGFVDQVLDIGSGESDGRGGKLIAVDSFPQGDFFQVDFENLFPPF